MPGMLQVAVIQMLLAAGAQAAPAPEWLRGGDDGKQPMWGIRGHLQFAIPPASRGPRGLIRILYPTLPGGQYDLINFIAVEPIVSGKRGLSELEYSRLDSTAGKRFWVDVAQLQGELSRGDVEILRVVIHVEEFENGARVRLIVEQRSDRPDEIAITIQPKSGSAPLEYCILTATMGNRARTRLLWLKEETVSSLKLYPDYKGPDFTPHTVYPLSRIAMTAQGDLLAAIASDEEQPAGVHPFPGTSRWYYGGVPVTQFWKKLKGTWRDDIEVAVNGRYMYWRSHLPIPGGIAFENFELHERFYAGQQFIFGVTPRKPADLGLPTADGPRRTSRPSD